QANAQELKQEPATPSQSQKDSKREVVAEDVEQLKSQVKQLQSLVEQQRRTLEEIQRRLEQSDETARKPATASLARTGEASAASPDLQAAGRLVHQTKGAADQPATQTSGNSPSTGQPASQEKPLPIVGWGRDHAFIRSPDGAFETQIGGYGQLDFRGYQSGNHLPNSFFEGPESL